METWLEGSVPGRLVPRDRGLGETSWMMDGVTVGAGDQEE